MNDQNPSRWILFGGTVFMGVLTFAGISLLAALEAPLFEIWTGLLATMAVVIFNVVLINTSKPSAGLGFSRFLLWVVFLAHVTIYGMGILRLAGSML